MRFGTYHTFQKPPGISDAQVIANELERVRLAEDLGFDSVWVPEQHFYDYCACPDALVMATHVAAITSRVRVGTAVVNLSLTDPLRFVERASLLDNLSQGRADICIGRGYQWPQNVVFGVAEDDTRPMFGEALDIVLDHWGAETPAGYSGDHYSFPPVRTYPRAARAAEDVLLFGIGGTTSLEETVERGLPLALSQPFLPTETTAETFARYVDLVTAADVDTDTFLDRAVVVLYASLAPTRAEARSIAKEPFEWHMSRLNALRGPQPDGQPFTWFGDSRAPGVLDDADYERRCDSTLVFDDPDGVAARIEMLRDAGVRNVVPWFGVGGVAQEHVVRALELFATEVAPRFR